MPENNRVLATLIIWLTFAALTIALFTLPSSAFNDASPGILLGVLIVLAIPAMIGTLAIWGALGETPAETPVSAAKDKRLLRDRMTQLVDDLEDNEIYELEALLLDREDSSGSRQSHR